MAYNVTGAYYENIRYSKSNVIDLPDDLSFSEDGTKMFVLVSNLSQFTLSRPWYISTATYDQVGLNLETNNGVSVYFKPDGTKFFYVDIADDYVYQYSISTPWDLTTASYDSKRFQVRNEDLDPRGIYFRDNGEKMFMVGSNTDTVYQYSLSTAWDISTASYDSISLDISATGGSPVDLHFNDEGDALFILEGNTVYEYNLSTAWDITTASLNQSQFPTHNETTARGMTFGKDGDKMYLTGETLLAGFDESDDDGVFQYATNELYERQKRGIQSELLVSWKKDFNASFSIFTIGTSTIGGNDYIGSEDGILSEWNKYFYFDESQYLKNLTYERKLKQPSGGLSKSIADIQLENTNGRFLPDHMGGTSELYTAILPRRPVIINAGFESGNFRDLTPQFVGVTTQYPRVDRRNDTVDMQAADFVDFLQNRYVDETSMFTGVRSDELIKTILDDQGLATAQYELDRGINTIGFALFEKGRKLSDLIDDIAVAENAHFYQDETGKLRFENRQHWTETDHSTVSYIISTSQVLEQESPSDDHIINAVEVKSEPRDKEPKQIVFRLAAPVELTKDGTTELFVDFDDPMLEIEEPDYVANTEIDDSGTDVTGSVSIETLGEFAQAAKYKFTYTGTTEAWITDIIIYGRPAKVQEEIYYRTVDDSSVTAFEERPYIIDNNYIQSRSWAQSFAEILLRQYSEAGDLQKIKIRAIPELSMGDLISWQGQDWRVYGIRTEIDPFVGFVQEVELLKRTVDTYFRIGISTIGSEDAIAP